MLTSSSTSTSNSRAPTNVYHRSHCNIRRFGVLEALFSGLRMHHAPLEPQRQHIPEVLYPLLAIHAFSLGNDGFRMRCFVSTNTLIRVEDRHLTSDLRKSMGRR